MIWFRQLQEFSNSVWRYAEILKETEEYRECSDRERVKCGVLDGADVRSFDVVIFVSVVIRRYIGSVHIQITSWITHLFVSSNSASAVPRRYLGPNTSGITCVNSHNRKCVTFINIWLSEMIASVGYTEVWFLVHWCHFERLTTTLILQRTFVASLPLQSKSFIFCCILF